MGPVMEPVMEDLEIGWKKERVENPKTEDLHIPET
jgi:hypothetical protein